MADKYFTCAETAKIVRTALKEAFKKDYPPVKFSVKSSVYAGGASITVRWVDGPAYVDVAKITDQFEGSTFDGSIDLKSYIEREYNGESVRFGADGVHCSRSYSRDFVEAIVRQFCERWGIAPPEITGTEQNAGIKTWSLEYQMEHALFGLLRSTSAKDMHRAYEAEEERRQREHEEWMKGEPERRAQAQREQEEWLKEEQKRQAEEQARREREARQQQEQERRQREQGQHRHMQAAQRLILANRATALAYLGLTMAASQADVMRAFRDKVKDAADGQGGYTLDMDFLVKVKQKALQ